MRAEGHAGLQRTNGGHADVVLVVCSRRVPLGAPADTSRAAETRARPGSYRGEDVRDGRRCGEEINTCAARGGITIERVKRVVHNRSRDRAHVKSARTDERLPPSRIGCVYSTQIDDLMPHERSTGRV